MKHHKLFDSIKLSLPDTWTAEIEDVAQSGAGQPQAQEATAFDEAEEKGHLNIKYFDIATESPQQQQQLLDSVFTETEKELLGNHLYWGLEELQGEEEGVAVSIKRWLVCSLQKAQTFNLLILSYSVAEDNLADDAIAAEIATAEEAIKSLKFL